VIVSDLFATAATHQRNVAMARRHALSQWVAVGGHTMLNCSNLSGAFALCVHQPRLLKLREAFTVPVRASCQSEVYIEPNVSGYIRVPLRVRGGRSELCTLHQARAV
jgi:hypothetical protein